MAMSRDGTAFWATTADAQLYLSQDRGVSWRVVSGLPSSGYIAGLAASPDSSGVVFAVTSEVELWAYQHEENLGSELLVGADP
jgi:hypothetical protein